MKPVQLFCWHFMAYPYLDKDFDKKESSGWVTVPNRLWDNTRSRGLYQEYIDQLAYADQLGFDGMVLNEHHQNIYGLMPSPNIIAAALTQKTSRGKIVILGNLLPLHLNPMVENHPVAFPWPTKAKVERGAKIIHVDPRFTRTSAVADIYAPAPIAPFWAGSSTTSSIVKNGKPIRFSRPLPLPTPMPRQSSPRILKIPRICTEFFFRAVGNQGRREGMAV